METAVLIGGQRQVHSLELPTNQCESNTDRWCGDLHSYRGEKFLNPFWRLGNICEEFNYRFCEDDGFELLE